jgi:hypothetical protein
MKRIPMLRSNSWTCRRRCRSFIARKQSAYKIDAMAMIANSVRKRN